MFIRETAFIMFMLLVNTGVYIFADMFCILDDDSVTKKLSTYVYDMPVVTWNDGYISKYKQGINLRRTGYKLSMTDEYKKLIDYMDFSTDDLPESFEISMRGRFTI